MVLSGTISDTIEAERTAFPRISLPTVEAIAKEVREQLGGLWMGSIYREQILPKRTRAAQLHKTARGERVEIFHTLLGIELKTGNHRLLCPDLATARYLAVWARVGCTSVAVPYDITQISYLSDELESSWHRMLLLVEHVAANRTEAFRSRTRALLLRDLKAEIERDGAGPTVPVFNQNTRQRK